jgi:hypothetical protein
MSLSPITDHVARRLARLATIYRNSESHKGVLSALTKQVQAIEDAAFGLLVLRSLNDAAAAQLDEVGRILGVEREGRTDDALRLRLRAQILINNRSGEVDTLLLIVRLLTPALASVSLDEFFPASAVGHVDGVAITDGPEIARLLRLAKAAGVNVQLTYQDTSDENVFTLSDVSQTGPGLGLGDSSNASVGGSLAGVS